MCMNLKNTYYEKTFIQKCLKKLKKYKNLNNLIKYRKNTY